MPPGPRPVYQKSTIASPGRNKNPRRPYALGVRLRVLIGLVTLPCRRDSHFGTVGSSPLSSAARMAACPALACSSVA